jgi:hypothetical protein
VVAVEITLAIAASFPFSGTPAPCDSRKLMVKKFPFNIIYQIVDDDIVIVAISHHARAPHYWKKRV